MNKIAVIGECMVELNLLNKDTYKQAFSGNGLNCSLSFKKVLENSEVEYITALGEDDLSKDMLNYFYSQNIKTNYINILKNKSPIMYINNDESNSTYFSSDLLNRDIFKTKISKKTMNRLLEFDLIYFTANSVAMMSKEGRVGFFKLLKKLRFHGVKTVFDSKYISIMYESSDDARKIYETSIHYADILLTSMGDEKKLWGDIDCINILQKANGSCCDEIVINNKNLEIIYSINKKIEKIKIEDIDDKNIFNAAYLSMRLEKKGIEESIINATRF
jgi:2-dehydro-3-deoxygluconokinase